MSKYKEFDIVGEVEKILVPILKDLNLELVDVEYVQEGGYKYLRVFIEEENDSITLGDCANVSNRIDEKVDNLIEEKFFLEVSSPGIERPLKKMKDFIRFSGEEISLSLKHKLEDKKNFVGFFEILDEDTILLLADNEKYEIPFKEIRKANLVFRFDE